LELDILIPALAVAALFAIAFADGPRRPAALSATWPDAVARWSVSRRRAHRL